MAKHTSQLALVSSLRRGRLWAAPAVGIAVALVAGVSTLLIDVFLLAGSRPPVPFQLDPDTARTLLSVTVSSLVTLLALVLTIVTVVLQLASGRYSHRAMRTFLRDAQSHEFLFTFAGMITYAMVAILGIGATVQTEPERVVGLTVPVAFLGVLVSLAVFVRYVDHIVHASRGTAIVARIADECRTQIDLLYPDEHDPERAAPEDPPPDDTPARVLEAPAPGVVDDVDVAALAAWATRHSARVVLRAPRGGYLPSGAPMLAVHRDHHDGGVNRPSAAGPDADRTTNAELGDAADHDDLGGHVWLDAEATITGDVLFGFRLLVDIGEIAISPAVNDPMTAVQCLDQLHDLLARLGRRRLDRMWTRDDDGVGRVYLPMPSWEDYVELAGEELRLYGASDLLIMRRMRGMWTDLAAIVAEDRRGPLLDQLRRVEQAGDRELPEDLADWRRDLSDGGERTTGTTRA